MKFPKVVFLAVKCHTLIFTFTWLVHMLNILNWWSRVLCWSRSLIFFVFNVKMDLICGDWDNNCNNNYYSTVTMQEGSFLFWFILLLPVKKNFFSIIDAILWFAGKLQISAWSALPNDAVKIICGTRHATIESCVINFDDIEMTWLRIILSHLTWVFLTIKWYIHACLQREDGN